MVLVMRPAVTKHPNSVAQTTEICPTALEAGRPGSRWRQGRLVAGPLSSASGRRLLAASSPGPSACERMVAEQAQVSVSSHKGSGSVGSGLTLMTSDLNAFCKDPVPRYSDAGAGVRPSAYEVGMGRGGRRAPGGEPGRLVSGRWQPPSPVSSGVCHPPPAAPGHCVPSPRDQNSLPTSRSVPPTSPPSPCQSLLPAEDHRPVALWISFPFPPQPPGLVACPWPLPLFPPDCSVGVAVIQHFSKKGPWTGIRIIRGVGSKPRFPGEKRSSQRKHADS